MTKQFASDVYDGVRMRIPRKRRAINIDEHNDRLARSRGWTEADDLGAMVDQPPIFQFSSDYEQALGYDPDEHNIVSTKGDCE